MLFFNSVSSPTANTAAAKYKDTGPFSEQSFPAVPPYLRRNLIQSANWAVAASTHSTYGTALSSWLQCCKDTGMMGQFPVNEDDVLTFVAWLLHKGNCSSTISAYLSGIRAAHLEKGLNPPLIRSDRVNTVLNGGKKRDNTEKKLGTKKSRIPITPTSLKLWKAELSSSDMSYHDKRLFWAVSAILYFGCLRPGELLCRNHNSFDPVNSMLQKDVTIKSTTINGEKADIIQIYLASEKRDPTGKGRLLDIYESGSVLCPVKALKKFIDISTQTDPKKPAFRLASGKNLTTNLFNKKLKEGLGKHLNTETGFVSGHSFRIGITSLVAQLGYSEDQIKALGRWSSQAYLTYLRLPQTRRQEIARSLQGATN